ncbi:hypothetical protein HF086_010437 [Spodoptera exigua]|uniref:Glycoside hydrolase family 65 C-terminal domain-containing protein n=1 Tax=Spodoptera exigua TaxID=7107 RepID=A0A922SML8_SPOEX|nr:hypothetical protein HF086_010437 [Spodoptera exigua]
MVKLHTCIVLQEDGEVLYQKHVDQWQKLYHQGGMEIEGNLELGKIVNGIWYYFLSALPSEESFQSLGRYYGLSPTGLARGGTFEDYEDIAWSLALPYDEENDYHPQFTNYQRGEEIKQADAVLLGFPLQYSMNISTRLNDLTYYESVTRENGPAMTWSMHTIGHLQLDDDAKAEEMFNRSYEGFVREPFKIWTELRRPDSGAVNFFTGMGGFLQTLVFGYAGVSIHLDRLEINKPRLPPKATKFTIRGIKYLGSNLTLEVSANSTKLSVTSMDDNWRLALNDGKYTVTLAPGITVILPGAGPFTVYSEPWKDCKLPADIIGHNYIRPDGT